MSLPIATAKPQAPPNTTRATNPTRAVRAGVLGILSAISSPSAMIVIIHSARGRARNSSLVPDNGSQPKCAAQHTVAGAVIDRSPSTQPKTKDTIKTNTFAT